MNKPASAPSANTTTLLVCLAVIAVSLAGLAFMIFEAFKTGV